MASYLANLLARFNGSHRAETAARLKAEAEAEARRKMEAETKRQIEDAEARCHAEAETRTRAEAESSRLMEEKAQQKAEAKAARRAAAKARRQAEVWPLLESINAISEKQLDDRIEKERVQNFEIHRTASVLLRSDSTNKIRWQLEKHTEHGNWEDPYCRGESMTARVEWGIHATERLEVFRLTTGEFVIVDINEETN